jgi:hypothetical protein
LSIGGYKSGIGGYWTPRALIDMARARIDRVCSIVLFGIIFSKSRFALCRGIFRTPFPLVKH